ncbi:MAG TPA: glycoside hydrolase family 2 TIM barrel-domain containing protein [Candidatus Nitrosotalea sp.]|nr:glycoside hydrolase family 2 TIM barrel-domain containing protein [Candidatus Nitrosotalea sp.]
MTRSVAACCRFNLRVWLSVALGVFSVAQPLRGAEDFAVALPPGVQAVWDINKAYRDSTATREQICLNGLWQWQPANAQSEEVPSGSWGWFKVPGCWPGITDYLQKDCQTVLTHPDWKAQNFRGLSAAWYQREITIPNDWVNRRIAVRAEYLNSFASVFVDGRRAGEIFFPGGEIDLSGVCQPGHTYKLGLLVIAMPLNGVMLSYSDTFGARQVKGTVERRGLCGDVFLVSTPSGPRLRDVRVRTSVRRWEITFEAALEKLAANASYRLRAQITDHARGEREFTSKPFNADEIKEGRIAFTESWKPDKLWDVHTPQNIYELQLSLVDGDGKVLDAALPERFGFREFWIDGRDFYLNGSRIFLCAVPFDNAQIGAAWATYDGARESFERLKSFGVNFVYTHNYGCEPGAHLSFAEILRAADDAGMLVSFSQPHFGQYQWKSADADRANGYARHAEFYVRAAGNHPSIVFYSMSHNATGTEEAMNPEMIDGIQDIRNRWSANNVKLAVRAEAIVERLDPGRIVYHHSSGNLGSMHTANFYANFAPIQEMSDWLEHWATKGVKPVFLCEYGVPISWDWMMYRGWYKGTREFGSAQVPWEFCLAEWDAQFLGDQAYQLTDLEKDCLRWESRQFRAGEVWHRWDYPRNAIESPDLDQRNAVLAMYLTDNLRAFRTWGMSAFCPWDHGAYWKLRDGVSRARRELKVDWANLQRPGFSPDYIDGQMEWINASFERSDWITTSAAEALIRNNGPLLAYIGGKPSAFTGKDHNFQPGDTIEKQLIVINNSRQTVSCDCSWSLALPNPISARKEVTVETGQQARVPLNFMLPDATSPGQYKLRANVRFNNGKSQTDVFAIDVLPRPAAVTTGSRIALFDPKGETARLLGAMGVPFTRVDANVDLSAYDILVAGREALTIDGPAPDIARVRDGLKVILFEQTSEVLEQRFGFRVVEYGLRRVFRRVPDHPLLAGIGDEHLQNWSGEAALLPPRLKYEMGPRYAPQVKWCDIPVTRVWRAGNRGNVASVLIEKPACGDFMPVIDGGFSLQFSPLLEYHEGKGMILFCQMDVTGRTGNDPAADRLTRNILQYVNMWKPTPRRELFYVGDTIGKRHLEHAGFTPLSYAGGAISTNRVLVVGSGGATTLTGHAADVADFLKSGGKVLALGLDEQNANAVLPFKVKTKTAEHIATFFDPFGRDSLLAGIGPADVHNRDPRELPLVTEGARVVGNGVLAVSQNDDVLFCQLVPYAVSPTAGNAAPANIRKTFRHSSYLLTRLLGNLGAAGSTPILERFHRPAAKSGMEARWRQGLYLDVPEEWDDPYRFFCW